MAERPPFLPLGRKTRWGKVAAVGIRDGERYYMMQKGNLTTLMPGDDWREDAKYKAWKNGEKA